jgi:very-short-patch-repair endonuclease
MTDEPPQQFTSTLQQWGKLKPLARGMRGAPTITEDELWQRLRNRRISGVKFRRQHAIDGFVVDFVSIEHRLIIEVDGDIHRNQQDYDTERQVILEAKGFRVIRFTNAEVLQSLESVIEVIAKAIAESSSQGDLTPNPSPA